MLFNSYEFMLFLTYSSNWIFYIAKIQSKYRKNFLSGHVLYFYAYFEAKYLLLIGVSLFTNAFIGQQIIKKRTKKPKSIIDSWLGV